MVRSVTSIDPDDEKAVETFIRAMEIIIADKMRPDFDWREDAPYLFLFEEDEPDDE
jgi:hypothetical protein